MINSGGARMVRRWSVRLAACSVMLPLLLAGCSEKHEASESLPATKTSSPATKTLPPLGPADFPLPAEARSADASGAEGALRYYIALITHQAGKSGAPLRALSSGCSFCDFLADRYDQDVAAGYVYKGGQISISSISPPALNADSAEFSFTASQTAVQILDSAGSPVAGRGDTAVNGVNSAAKLIWSQNKRAWIVHQLSFQAT